MPRLRHDIFFSRQKLEENHRNFQTIFQLLIFFNLRICILKYFSLFVHLTLNGAREFDHPFLILNVGDNIFTAE